MSIKQSAEELQEAKEQQLFQRADLALSDLTTNGGILLPEQGDRFIRTLIEQPTLLSQARVITMNSPIQKINKIKFGSRILQNASQDPTANDAVNLGRYLKNGSKPTTDQVTLTTKEVIAKVLLSYEVIEDNIERDNFQDTLLTLMAQRVAVDLEELIISGDTNSADPYLALLNGLLVKTTHNIVDGNNESLDPELLSSMVLAMPKQFRSIAGQQYWTSSNAEIVMRNTIASRNTGLGDAYLTGTQPITIQGKRLQGIHMMPIGKAILTDPRNIIVGFQRMVRLESFRDIEARQIKFIMTARLDMALEEELAVVKAINLAN